MKLSAFLVDQFSPSPGSIKIPIGGVIEGYRQRYDKLIKSGKRFQHSIYTVMPGERKMIHVKVPSESIDPGFWYDIVLELDYGKDVEKFEDCDIKVFSNSPSFIFSYAYVFSHWSPEGRPTDKRDRMMVDRMKGRVPRDSMLIWELSPKIGPQPTHDRPVVRNPMGIPMFDKSIYFAVFYIMDNLTMAAVRATHNNVTMAQVIASVMDYDRLMNERKRQENRMRERKARDKATQVKVTRVTERDIFNRARGIKQPIQPRTAQSISSSAGHVRSMRSTQQVKSTRIKK